MSKKQFRSQASSSRAVSGAFGASAPGSSSGAFVTSSFGTVSSSSSLSYIYEPPDLSNITAPNVIVAFKNLQKKDSTTKSKALEELQAYISSLNAKQGDVEESVLETWIALYPRTSIECARRVRQLAHSLQGQIFASCGKRVARSMAKIIGSWLAGLYDNDRGVSRAAQESLKQVFPSEEKLSNLWRLYQTSIIAYSLDVITKETVNTLSDERTTSPDDALAKHARVLATGILMVTHLIDNVAAGELVKSKTLIDGFVAEEKVWNLASHADPFVRRSVYRLLLTALRQEFDLDMKLISRNILASSLHLDQLGSALDYAKALALLTEHCPLVWTAYYTGSGKKSAQKRLCQFLKKGSQRSTPEFWSQIAGILRQIPTSLLQAGTDDDVTAKSSDDDTSFSSPILDAIHEGLCSKDEPRANLSAAWKAYLDVAIRVQSILAEKEALRLFSKTYLLPIVKQYATPCKEWSPWTLPKSEQRKLCAKTFQQIWRGADVLMQETLLGISATLVRSMKTSLPEQSKDYTKSQETISEDFQRWYGLQAAIMQEDSSKSFRLVFVQSLTSELPAAMDSLKTRNGKPYGAAAAMVAALQLTPGLLNEADGLKKLLISFVRDETPKLFTSPSAPYLLTLLGLMKGELDVNQVYGLSLKTLQDAPESATKSKILESILASEHLALGDYKTLAKVFDDYLEAALNKDSSGWSFILAAMQNPATPASLVQRVLSAMTDAISGDDKLSTSIHGLKLVVENSQRCLQILVTSSAGPHLLSRLLHLAESPDEAVARDAQYVSVALESKMSSGQGSGQASRSRHEIIKQGLESPDVDSLSIDTLLRQARTLFEQAESNNSAAVVADILPNAALWREALSPFLISVPNPSLAITNSLSCAISLVQSSPIPARRPKQSVARDAEGFSSALRTLSYVTKLVDTVDVLPFCKEEDKVSLCEHLCLTIQLAGDQLAVPGAEGLWDTSLPDPDQETVSLVAEAQNLLAKWIYERPDFIPTVQKRLLDGCHGRTVISYYSARAYSAMTTEIGEVHGNIANDPQETIMQKSSKSFGAESFFQTSALLTSASESKQVTRLANEFLATLTGHDLQKDVDNALRSLMSLNYLLYKHEDLASAIPQQRLIFFIKHIASQSQDYSLADPVLTEIFRAQTVILPCLKDLYGDFWESTLDVLSKTWSHPRGSEDSDIPLINASLRLGVILRSLSVQDSNDDLQEAWTGRVSMVSDWLLGLLQNLQGVSDESHQPRMITNELLSRELAKTPPKMVINAGDFYEVLASDSVALQQSAYRILHDYIPKAQEQISLDKALSKDYIAQLPEELLSLILAAPNEEVLLEADLRRSIPAPLRSYLLSWKLVYDHWKGSSYAVQADYSTSLQDGVYLKGLLDFSFEQLITGRSRPVDASKFEIMGFSPDQEDTPEKDLQCFLTHLYALSLTCVPNLSKTWWRDSTSRQTMLAVESWTEKFISPLIIFSELNNVSSWGPSQAVADQPLSVKVSISTREVTASIPIDEQTMSIAVRLPKSYPLSRATVESVHRVGVDERKWRSWIITTQGVINFSNEGNGGSLIEGLLAWRKNVTATLKGQTECAICYSVVSAERQLPNKKCGTCKNMFHGGCLFRWFKSSNSSSCPLCRNPFNYA